MVNALTTNAPSGGIEFHNVEIPDQKDFEIKLKPLYTGICGTDRGEVNGSLSFTLTRFSGESKK